MLAATLDDPRFEREDGGWRLADAAPRGDLVAVAIETTGQDPARAALVQIAACRVEDGRIGPAFQTVINPERRLPGWLAERLGVDPGVGDDAPTLGEALDEFREFLGDGTLVGLDIGWTLRFLNVQCRRAGRRPIFNPVRDLLPEAAKSFGHAKPTLGTLAAWLGISAVRRHRGDSDARLIAAIALRLNASDPTPVSSRLVEMAGLAPDAPGVYLFCDETGQPLYIGKAKRLRARVQSYLTRPADHERDLSGLRAMSASLDWQTTPDDLAATLLEAELIEAHQPRFNTQRRTAPAPALLELSPHEPFPRLRRVAEPGPGRFGPFASGAVAAREAALLRQIFPLRTCVRKIGVARKTKPRPPCSLLELGRCLGPCTGNLPVAHYSAIVRQASAFLGGDRRVGLAALQSRAQQAAARGDRAEADRLLALLRTLATRWSGDLLAPPFDPANVAIRLGSQCYVVIEGLLRWAGPLAELAEERLLPADDLAKRGGVLAGRWLTTNRRMARLAPLGRGLTLAEAVARVHELAALDAD